MKPAFPPSADHGDGKSLYRAAILETDKDLIKHKVSAAESAVLARERELFYGGGTREEQESLDDALCARRAFRTAWEHTEIGITETSLKAAA